MNTALKSGFAAITFSLLAGLSAGAQDAPSGDAPSHPPRKLAFIGASITAGFGTADHKKSSYPAQLARMLGSGWEVGNFGVSGTTLLHDGDAPYVRTPSYQQALAFHPDLLVIDLGANDSKPQNFEAHPDDFIPDYKALIAAFQQANPNIKIYAALPVPAFPENYGIRESVIVAKIIPAIQQVVADTHIASIDLHTPMTDKGADFPDKIHPNEAGAKALAEVVYGVLKTDFPTAP